MGQLTKVRKHFTGRIIKVAYEASYTGFTLQRDLADKGIHCDVVAPSSIPRQGGKAIKTDRIDAAQLAQFYASDLLTIPPRQNSCRLNSSVIYGGEEVKKWPDTEKHLERVQWRGCCRRRVPRWKPLHASWE
jgi:hypothetical protein